MRTVKKQEQSVCNPKRDRPLISLRISVGCDETKGVTTAIFAVSSYKSNAGSEELKSGQSFIQIPRPMPPRTPVPTVPSVISNIEGNRLTHGLFPAGQNCLAFPSMAVTVGR